MVIGGAASLFWSENSKLFNAQASEIDFDYYQEYLNLKISPEKLLLVAIISRVCGDIDHYITLPIAKRSKHNYTIAKEAYDYLFNNYNHEAFSDCPFNAHYVISETFGPIAQSVFDQLHKRYPLPLPPPGSKILYPTKLSPLHSVRSRGVRQILGKYI